MVKDEMMQQHNSFYPPSRRKEGEEWREMGENSMLTDKMTTQSCEHASSLVPVLGDLLQALVLLHSVDQVRLLVAVRCQHKIQHDAFQGLHPYRHTTACFIFQHRDNSTHQTQQNLINKDITTFDN